MARFLHQSYGRRMIRRIHFDLACIMLLIAMFSVENPRFLISTVCSALFVRADNNLDERILTLDQPSSSPTLISLKNAQWNQPTYSPSKLIRNSLLPSVVSLTSSPAERVESFPPSFIGSGRPSLTAPNTAGQTSIPSIRLSTSNPQLTTSFPSIAPISKPSSSPSQLVTSSPTTEIPSNIPSYAPTSAQIGDGWCDSGDLNLPDLNNADCNYDGGDCCLATCNSDNSFACGTVEFNCINPNYFFQMKSSNFTLLLLIANFSLVPSSDGSTPDEKATEIALNALTFIAIEQQPEEFLGSSSSGEVSVISRISTVFTQLEGRLVGDVEVVITTYFNTSSNSSSDPQRRLQQQQQDQDENTYTPSSTEFNLQRSLRYAAQVLVLPSLANVIVCSNRSAAECVTRAEPVSLVVKGNDDSTNALVCIRSEGMWQTWYGSPRSLPVYLVVLIIFSTMWVMIMLTLFASLTLLSQMWGKGLSAAQVIRNLTWVVLSIAAVLRFLCNIWILSEADVFAGARDGEQLIAAACYEFAYLDTGDGSRIDKESTTDTLPLFILGMSLFYCMFAATSLLRSLQRVIEQNMSFERQRGFFANLFITAVILFILMMLNVISAILWAAGVYSQDNSVVLVVVALTQAICGIIIMLQSLATSSTESAILCVVGVLYIITSYPDVVENAGAAFWLSSILCRVLEILWAVLYLKLVLTNKRGRRVGNGFAPTIVHAVPVFKKNNSQQGEKKWQRQRMARYILMSDRIIDDLEECNHPEWIQEWIAQEEEKDAFVRM